MGSTLARKALLPRADLGLSHGARLVLVAMAIRAKDTDPEPIYFGGWPVLGHALGREWDNPAYQAVARYLAELKEAKLVSVQAGAHYGRQATYRLHLDPWD